MAARHLWGSLRANLNHGEVPFGLAQRVQFPYWWIIDSIRSRHSVVKETLLCSWSGAWKLDQDNNCYQTFPPLPW